MKKPISDKSQPQIEKFKAIAKELEADGDEKQLDQFVHQIARKNDKKKST
jgi:hypothetical protein